MLITEERFIQIFKMYNRRLVYFAKKYVGDFFCEDIVSQTLIKVRTIDDQGDIAIRSWLYNSVRNACINWLKKEIGKDTTEIGYSYLESISDDDFKVDEIRSELMEKICTEIEKLHPLHKKVMILIVNGYDNPSIADKLNISIDTIRTYKKRFADSFTKSEEIPEKKCIQLTYNGVTKTLSEWSKDLGISRHALYGRYQCKWSIKEILGIVTKQPYVIFNGQRKTLSEWSKELNILYGTLRDRYDKDWPAHLILNKNGWIRPKKTVSGKDFILFNGVKRTLIEWSKELGIPYNTIWQRYENDLPAHLILEKTKPEKFSVTLNGVKKSLGQWAKELNIDYNTLYVRYTKNLPPELILSPQLMKKGPKFKNQSQWSP